MPWGVEGADLGRTLANELKLNPLDCFEWPAMVLVGERGLVVVVVVWAFVNTVSDGLCGVV